MQWIVKAAAAAVVAAAAAAGSLLIYFAHKLSGYEFSHFGSTAINTF